MQIFSNDLPRNQSLPLFKPHVTSLVCNFESAHVPAIDAQADQWYREALAHQSPDRIEEPDYKRILQLTRMAADRRHWKAMLNLATLYLENRDPAHGVEDAVRLVEEAMVLGVPSAFDRMGTYHMKGIGVHADATRAYAFWQKAAEMGSPDALAYLGSRLGAGRDGALPGYWANIPVATKMLECALAQGHGDAAYNLHFLHREPRAADGAVNGDRTSGTKARAVKTLHEGVRFGCADCAGKLWLDFYAPRELADMLVPFIDKARAARYRILSNELDFNHLARFPNIDKVVPLPPADLPPWNGDRDTLLAAAMGVSLPLVKPIVSSPAPHADRYYLDPNYALRRSSTTTRDAVAPMAGYWRPTAQGGSEQCRALLDKIGPGLYGKGEAFQTLSKPGSDSICPISSVVWEHYLTVPVDDGNVNPRAVRGLTRVIERCAAMEVVVNVAVCPTTGTWQPWLRGDHPLQGSVNQWWRQVWLRAGQAFPQLRQDWNVPVDDADVAWHLLDDSDPALV